MNMIIDCLPMYTLYTMPRSWSRSSLMEMVPEELQGEALEGEVLVLEGEVGRLVRQRRLGTL